MSTKIVNANFKTNPFIDNDHSVTVFVYSEIKCKLANIQNYKNILRYKLLHNHIYLKQHQKIFL